MGHTLRGAVTAWLGLIALSAVVRNSGQATGALATINNVLQRALSPDVPAIPDRRTGAGSSSKAGGYFNMTPEQLGKAVAAAKTGQAVQSAGPNSVWNKLSTSNLPSASQGAAAAAVDWSAVAQTLSQLPHP
jgi:hypothetical protein